MEFNEENCLKVSDLFDKNNDDDKVYEFFMNLINNYLNKYNYLDEIEIEDEFRGDTKNIFNLANKIFCKEEIINELGDKNDKSYDDSEYGSQSERSDSRGSTSGSRRRRRKRKGSQGEVGDEEADVEGAEDADQ